MMRQSQNKRRNLQVRDFICRRCRVEPTASVDHICDLCQAIGKTAVPEEEGFSLQDLLLSTEFTREAFFRLKEFRPNWIRR